MTGNHPDGMISRQENEETFNESLPRLKFRNLIRP